MARTASTHRRRGSSNRNSSRRRTGSRCGTRCQPTRRNRRPVRSVRRTGLRFPRCTRQWRNRLEVARTLTLTAPACPEPHSLVPSTSGVGRDLARRGTSRAAPSRRRTSPPEGLCEPSSSLSADLETPSCEDSAGSGPPLMAQNHSRQPDRTAAPVPIRPAQSFDTARPTCRADSPSRSTRRALIRHRRPAVLSSYDVVLEHCGLLLAKYIPVAPSTSGEDAR